MSTDASSGTTLTAELEKAAALLKTAGLDHAAAQLLAPESEKSEEKAEPKKAKKAAKKAEPKVEKKAEAKKAEPKKAAPTKAAKKAAKKVVKAAKAEKKEKRKATSGQSGPSIEALPWSALNKKEKLVIGCFNLKGEREVKTIEQIADEVFKGKAKNVKQANSWVRNSLRRLMRFGRWLEKVEPGKYRITLWGREAQES